MKSAIKEVKVIWTCRDDKLETIFTQPVGEIEADIPCPENFGSGTLHVLEMNLGMDLGRIKLKPNSKYETEDTYLPFFEVKGNLIEPMISFLSVKSGQASVHDHLTAKKYDIDRRQNVFQNIDKNDTSYYIKKGQQLDLVSLKMGLSTLSLFLGEEVTRSLLHNLNIGETPSSNIHTIPLEISTLLHAALNSHLTGDIRKIHAQSAILNYLSQLSHYLECSKERPPIIKQLKIEKIRNDLLNHKGKLPSLDELTTQYGMSATALSTEFKKLTGKPIHSFILDHRLDNSYQMLEQSDIAMKVLAQRIGYSHVNHFITAFKKKFNRTPGSLRR